MSLHYTLVFGLLISELLATLVLVILPLPKTVRKAIYTYIDRSQTFQQVGYVLKIIFVFVGVLFAESIRSIIKAEQMRKAFDDGTAHSHDSDKTINSKLFVAQRNMYLTGFTLFLSLVLHRLHPMLVQMVKAEDVLSVLKKQATNNGNQFGIVADEVEDLKKENKTLKENAEKWEKHAQDRDILVKQAKQQHDEYLRMSDKAIEAERKSNGVVQDKKSD